MKVIAAINGTITAESMAFYALKYAKVQNLTLVLLHIENLKDDLKDVQSSMDRVTTIAMSSDVVSERVILNGSVKKAIKEYLSDIFVDIIFCSTRKHKNYITDSFSLLLTKIDIEVDIAVVRIVNMDYIMDVKNLLLSINSDSLSVKKFTFFATLASAYKADSEIYSVSSMSKLQLSRVDIHSARERLGVINYNLRHYLKLAKFMPFSLYIKHDFTNSEAQSILSHMVKSNTHLVVIGAKRLSVKSFFQREMPIEKLMDESSVNIIAYYPKED